MNISHTPSVQFAVTNNGNHSAREWAILCVNQIINKAIRIPGVHSDVPELVIDRERMAQVIENYIVMAVEAETIAGQSLRSA